MELVQCLAHTPRTSRAAMWQMSAADAIASYIYVLSLNDLQLQVLPLPSIHQRRNMPYFALSLHHSWPIEPLRLSLVSL